LSCIVGRRRVGGSSEGFQAVFHIVEVEVRVGVFLVVSAAFGDDGFDFGNAVLDCLFVGDGDALPFDLALGHTLPNELCEDIAGEDRWSFA
jgi:hypothetical protein